MVKITSKRQATLPRQLCDEMRLSPGDSIEVEPIVHNGERMWVMRPIHDPDLSFFGCLRGHAKKTPVDMDRIRDDIVKAMRERGLD
jgi:bifunctional DNA-binding transcriptional regulator/antitoxin component of YhaV-PrlF toxin-antitoxin module